MEYRKALSAIGKDSLSSLIDILAGRAAHVAVATHDGALAEEAVKRLLTTSTSCEIEQMSSLPQNCARIAKRHGLPMRVYIPHGYPSLPYNLRHAATRPIIIGWAVRDLILGPRNKLSPAEIVSDSTS
jgi:proline dehydrogenase